MISATVADLRNVLLNAHPNSSWREDLLRPYKVLDDKSLQQLVDLIQSELDLVTSTECVNPAVSDGSVFHRRCLQALRFLSTRYRTLPSSLVIHDVQRKGQLPVGGGGFADIWKGISGNQQVCLKVLRLLVEPDEQVREKTHRRFCNEAILWKQLKHPNILPLLGVNVKLFEPSFCLISPWMKNKDVIMFLRHNPSHNRHKALQEISAGLSYLHSRNPPITHGDIRGANILITSDFRCCLADFGLALVTANSESWAASTTSNMKGAIRWMAPELFSGLAEEAMLDHPSRDIYAFGCTIVEIISLQHPFHDLKTDYAVLTSLISGKRPARPQSNWCTDPLWYLTTSCWTQNPSDRPKAYDVYTALQQDVQDNAVPPDYHAIPSPRIKKVPSDDKNDEDWDEMEMTGFGNQPSSVDTVKGGNIMELGSPSLLLSLPNSMGPREMVTVFDNNNSLSGSGSQQSYMSTVASIKQQQLDGQPRNFEQPRAYVQDDSTLPIPSSSRVKKEDEQERDKTQIAVFDYEEVFDYKEQERDVDAEEGDTLLEAGLGGDNEDGGDWLSEDESGSVQGVATALKRNTPRLNSAGPYQSPSRFQLFQPSRRFQPPHRSQPSRRSKPPQSSRPSRRSQSSHHSQPSRRSQPLHRPRPSRHFQPSRRSRPSSRFQPPRRSQPSHRFRQPRHFQPSRRIRPPHSSQPPRRSRREQQHTLEQMLRDAALEAERQREMFTKVPKDSYSNLLTGPKPSLLSQLLNQDPDVFPDERDYPDGGQSGGLVRTDFQPITDITTSGTGPSNIVVLSSTRRPSIGGSGISFSGAIPALRPTKSTIAVPITDVVNVSSCLSPLSGADERRHGKQREQPEREDDDPKQVLPIFQRTAQEKISALARRSKVITFAAPPFSSYPEVLIHSPPLEWYVGPPHKTRAPLPRFPYNLPPAAPPSSPRTTRQLMLRKELSDDLRRNLIWSRKSQ